MYADRVKRTTSCQDAEYIPKVENAGEIKEENGQKYQVMHNGVKVIYGGYHGDWMGEVIKSLRGHHEPQEEKVFFEILKHVPKGGTMIELGSFWAYYSAWFNQAIEGARNYMIEPNVEKIEVGKKNFVLNGMTGNFINAFIGQTSSEFETFTDWNGKGTTLPMVAIDDFIQEHHIDKVDVLHSDIQGAELDMLNGCANSIRDQKISFFFLSTHGNKHNACKKTLEDAGYVICAEHTIEESVSADGLLVAHAPKITRVERIEITKFQASLFQRLHRLSIRVIRKVLSWLQIKNPHLGN